MFTYKIINPIGGPIGKSTYQKITDSKNRYGVKAVIEGGEIEAYGCPEYSIVTTDCSPESEFIQSLKWDCKVQLIEG